MPLFFLSPLLSPTAVAAPTPIDAQRGGDLALQEAMPPCTTVYATEKKPFRAASASSELTEGKLTHAASRAIDGNLSTAWVEGAKGPGVGETLRVELDGEGDVPAGLWVVPGYARDEARWTKNQRVATLEVRFLKPAEGTDPSRAWAEKKLVLADTEPLRVTLQKVDGKVPMEGQAIPLLPHFDQNMEVTELVALELAIIETDGTGAQYEDTCISEVAQLTNTTERSITCHPDWCAGPGKGSAGCP